MRELGVADDLSKFRIFWTFYAPSYTVDSIPGVTRPQPWRGRKTKSFMLSVATSSCDCPGDLNRRKQHATGITCQTTQRESRYSLALAQRDVSPERLVSRSAEGDQARSLREAERKIPRKVPGETIMAIRKLPDGTTETIHPKITETPALEAPKETIPRGHAPQTEVMGEEAVVQEEAEEIQEEAQEIVNYPPDPIPRKTTIIEDDVVFISVGRELKDHYDVVLRTRDEVLDDPEAKGSEKAAILNATTSIIKDLAKAQQDIYNSDSTARLQQAVYNALGDVSKDLQDKVIAAMERRFEEIS